MIWSCGMDSCIDPRGPVPDENLAPPALPLELHRRQESAVEGQ
jgi:hypothetical protein